MRWFSFFWQLSHVTYLIHDSNLSCLDRFITLLKIEVYYRQYFSYKIKFIIASRSTTSQPPTSFSVCNRNGLLRLSIYPQIQTTHALDFAIAAPSQPNKECYSGLKEKKKIKTQAVIKQTSVLGPERWPSGHGKKRCARQGDY